MKLTNVAVAVVAAVGLAGPASAAQISGSIGFSGVGSTWAFDGTDGFTLTPGTNNIEVDTVSGDFNTAGSQLGDVGTMYDVNVNSLPVTPQWTMGIFTFTLNSATVDNIDNTLPFLSLNMSGSGTVSAAGFDPTPGLWSWTGTSVDGISFTFAPTTAAVPDRVPEPGTLALLGLSLLGLSAARRRKA